MDNLYEDVLKINNKWDIEDVKLIFKRGLMEQKSALTPSVKKDEIIDIFIIMCKTLIKESTELDSTDKVGDKNITNITVRIHNFYIHICSRCGNKNHLINDELHI